MRSGGGLGEGWEVWQSSGLGYPVSVVHDMHRDGR